MHSRRFEKRSHVNREARGLLDGLSIDIAGVQIDTGIREDKESSKSDLKSTKPAGTVQNTKFSSSQSPSKAKNVQTTPQTKGLGLGNALGDLVGVSPTTLIQNTVSMCRQGVTDLVGDAVNDVTKVVDKAGAVVTKVVGDVGEGVGNAIDDVGHAVTGVAGDATSAVGGILRPSHRPSPTFTTRSTHLITVAPPQTQKTTKFSVVGPTKAPIQIFVNLPSLPVAVPIKVGLPSPPDADGGHPKPSQEVSRKPHKSKTEIPAKPTRTTKIPSRPTSSHTTKRSTDAIHTAEPSQGAGQNPPPSISRPSQGEGASHTGGENQPSRDAAQPDTDQPPIAGPAADSEASTTLEQTLASTEASSTDFQQVFPTLSVSLSNAESLPVEVVSSIGPTRMSLHKLVATTSLDTRAIASSHLASILGLSSLPPGISVVIGGSQTLTQTAADGSVYTIPPIPSESVFGGLPTGNAEVPVGGGGNSGIKASQLIGIVIAVFVFLLLGFFLFYIRKRHRAQIDARRTSSFYGGHGHVLDMPPNRDTPSPDMIQFNHDPIRFYVPPVTKAHTDPFESADDEIDLFAFNAPAANTYVQQHVLSSDYVSPASQLRQNKAPTHNDLKSPQDLDLHYKAENLSPNLFQIDSRAISPALTVEDPFRRSVPAVNRALLYDLDSRETPVDPFAHDPFLESSFGARAPSRTSFCTTTDDDVSFVSAREANADSSSSGSLTPTPGDQDDDDLTVRGSRGFATLPSSDFLAVDINSASSISDQRKSGISFQSEWTVEAR